MPSEPAAYIDVSDGLIGSESDNYRHLIARAAFLNHLRLDRRVNELFDVLIHETGLFSLLLGACNAIDEFAQVVRLNRHDAFTVTKWPKIRNKGQERVRLSAGNRVLE